MQLRSSSREILMMTQQEMANYLGVPRSVLNMYERGERSLPTHAMLKMGKLEISIHKYHFPLIQGETAVNIAHPCFDKQKMMQKKLRTEYRLLQRSVERMSQELELMKDCYEASKCLEFVVQEMRSNTALPLSENDKYWLSIQETNLKLAFADYSPENQFFLQQRLEGKKLQLAATEKSLDLLETRAAINALAPGLTE